MNSCKQQCSFYFGACAASVSGISCLWCRRKDYVRNELGLTKWEGKALWFAFLRRRSLLGLMTGFVGFYSGFFKSERYKCRTQRKEERHVPHSLQ
jgi:hypothetical protein